MVFFYVGQPEKINGFARGALYKYREIGIMGEDSEADSFNHFRG